MFSASQRFFQNLARHTRARPTVPTAVAPEIFTHPSAYRHPSDTKFTKPDWKPRDGSPKAHQEVAGNWM